MEQKRADGECEFRVTGSSSGKHDLLVDLTMKAGPVLWYHTMESIESIESQLSSEVRTTNLLPLLRFPHSLLCRRRSRGSVAK